MPSWAWDKAVNPNGQASGLPRATFLDEDCVFRVLENASLHEHLKEEVVSEQRMEEWKLL